MRDTSQRVTIQHVADAAEVSIATVSRVLNGGKVRADLTDRVRAVAKDLGYRPFSAARDLASGVHRTVGVLVPDLGNPYFNDVIKAASVGAARDGYRIVISDTGDDPDVELDICRERYAQVDGLLLISSRIKSRELKSMSNMPVPTVLVNVVEPGVELTSIAVDNFSAMLELCFHLSKLGHKRVVYMAGPEKSWQNRERWRAIEQAKVLGLQPIRLEVGSSIEDGYLAVDEVLMHKPTAILGFNDLVAAGALTRLRELNLRVPDDISVTGFDGIDFSRHTVPALTTAASPRRELGEYAWSAIRALMNSSNIEQVPLLKAEVILRESTGPAPA